MVESIWLLCQVRIGSIQGLRGKKPNRTSHRFYIISFRHDWYLFFCSHTSHQLNYIDDWAARRWRSKRLNAKTVCLRLLHTPFDRSFESHHNHNALICFHKHTFWYDAANFDEAFFWRGFPARLVPYSTLCAETGRQEMCLIGSMPLLLNMRPSNLLVYSCDTHWTV